MHRTRCPPCRGYTPELASSYTSIVAMGKSFEIVFVSSDQDEPAFQSYFAEMPWLALPFADRLTKQALSDKFDIKVANLFCERECMYVCVCVWEGRGGCGWNWWVCSCNLRPNRCPTAAHCSAPTLFSDFF